MKRGRLIVFEGIDGSGKSTQVARLAARLRKQGITATVFHFPRYDTPVGRFIKAALDGQFGDLHAVDPHFTTLPYLLDKMLAQAEITAALKKGIVICDRYVPSSLAYQAANLSGAKRGALLHFIEHFAYRELGIRKPDLVVYLDMPANTAQKLLLEKSKGRSLDIFERKAAYQRRVAALYDTLKTRQHWRTVPCTRFGKLEHADDIHERVARIVGVS